MTMRAGKECQQQTVEYPVPPLPEGHPSNAELVPEAHPRLHISALSPSCLCAALAGGGRKCRGREGAAGRPGPGSVEPPAAAHSGPELSAGGQRKAAPGEGREKAAAGGGAGAEAKEDGRGGSGGGGGEGAGGREAPEEEPAKPEDLIRLYDTLSRCGVPSGSRWVYQGPVRSGADPFVHLL